MSICRWIIFGSGFGLYGYLPTILKHENHEIFLQKKYKSVLIRRPELNCFLEKIKWYENLEDVINCIDSAVIACNPERQPSIIKNLLKGHSIKRFILEKPLAIDPVKADNILKILIQQKISFTINYSFIYTDWFKVLKLKIKSSKESFIFCDWLFEAHHFKNNLNNWKANHKFGGGPLRFYGIHLIAMLSALGYKKVTYSKIFKNSDNLYFKWEATFESELLPVFKISLNTNSISKKSFVFYVEDKKKLNTIICYEDPFDEESAKGIFDKRINITEKVITDVFYKEKTNFYQNTVNLWKKCEQKLVAQN